MIKTFISKAFHKIEKIQTENHRTRKIVKDQREVTEVEEALLPGIDVIKHVQTRPDQKKKVAEILEGVAEGRGVLLQIADVIKHVQTSQDQNLIENCTGKVGVEKVLFTVII